jgi:hypothetical protein
MSDCRQGICSGRPFPARLKEKKEEFFSTFITLSVPHLQAKRNGDIS